MKDIRQELQEYLENEVRILNDWSVNKEVAWEDIEELCNRSERKYQPHPEYDTNNHWIFSDCVEIDQMCQEILGGDFSKALKIIERYRGVKLVNSENFSRLLMNDYHRNK
jgi:CBS domain containing-hemolysin-like protein